MIGDCSYSVFVTGRWNAMGDELFTVCDRTKTFHCLAPVCFFDILQTLFSIAKLLILLVLHFKLC